MYIIVIVLNYLYLFLKFIQTNQEIQYLSDCINAVCICTYTETVLCVYDMQNKISF